MIKNVAYLVALFLIVSCQLSVEDEIAETRELLVVEGEINDGKGPQEIKISISNEYLSSETPPEVLDAKVEVFDNIGRKFDFIHYSNGLYLSDSSFSGELGLSYTLRIILSSSDTIISSSAEMSEVHDIDFLTYESYPGIDEQTGEEILLYFPIIFANDPQGEENFYRWKLYKNDTLFSSVNDIVLLDDRFIEGNYKNEFIGFEYLESDRIKVEVYSIDQPTFEYLTLLKKLVSSLGTAGGISPTSLTGNLLNISNRRNQVLGYFTVVSVKNAEVTIIP